MRLAVAVAVIAGFVVTVTGYTTLHYRGLYNTEMAQKHARSVLAVEYRDRWRKVPQSFTSVTFGAPYNVSLKCRVTGSAEGPNDTRVPLDLGRAAKPGDVYRKTCVATAPTDPSMPEG